MRLCESCEHCPAQVVVTFDDGECFQVCRSCAKEANYGREVNIREAIRQLQNWDQRAALAG